MESEIEKAFRDHIAAVNALSASKELSGLIARAASMCIETLNANGRILLAGNGGSAADAQHLAGELVSRFQYDRPGLAGIALTVDTSVLTAVGNDYGYERVFARQLEALARPGDVFIALSTSGNSQNIVEAARWARESSVHTIGLTGRAGGRLRNLVDICICAPSDETPRIQEMHILIGHTLCGLIEGIIFPRDQQVHRKNALTN